MEAYSLSLNMPKDTKKHKYTQVNLLKYKMLWLNLMTLRQEGRFLTF